MYKLFAAFNLAVILILTVSTTSLAALQVNLEISTPDPDSDTGVASNRLVMGADTTATDGYDNKFDTIALLNGPLQAFFAHPEYEAGYQKLWRDFRNNSLPKEWEIEVVSSNANNTVNITWEISAQKNILLNLIDKDTNQEISLNSETEYSYSNVTSKKFLLRASGNSSGGGAKGGGCGYIRYIEKSGGNPINNYGHAAINMLILIAPLLIPILYHRRLIKISANERSYRNDGACGS